MVHRSKQLTIRNRRQNKFNNGDQMKNIRMRCSNEPKDRIYVKGYGFLSLAKNMGKRLSNRYGQILYDSSKKFTTDVIKTASKRAI